MLSFRSHRNYRKAHYQLFTLRMKVKAKHLRKLVHLWRSVRDAITDVIPGSDKTHETERKYKIARFKFSIDNLSLSSLPPNSYEADQRYLCVPSRDDVFKLLVGLHENRNGNQHKTVNFCNRKRPAKAIFTNIRFLG